MRLPLTVFFIGLCLLVSESVVANLGPKLPLVIVGFCLLISHSVAAADDPAKPADPWIGAIVYGKTADVGPKDDRGVVMRNFGGSIGSVKKAEGDRLDLESTTSGFPIEAKDAGSVAKTDVVRREEAEAFFSEQIRLKPSAYAYRSRAWARLLSVYDHDPAKQAKVRAMTLADLDEAIRLDPKDAATYTARASLPRTMGRNDDQILADLDEAIRLNTEDRESHTSTLRRRAALHLKKGQEARFLADYDELFRLAGEDVEHRVILLHNRAVAYGATGKHEAKALTDYANALKLAGDQPRLKNGVLISRAMFFSSKGKKTEAMADYEEAVRLTPTNAVVHYLRASFYLKAEDEKIRDVAKTLESATKAVELSDGKVPVYLLFLAMAEAESGDFDKALKTLDRADGVLVEEDGFAVVAKQFREAYRKKTLVAFSSLVSLSEMIGQFSPHGPRADKK